MNLGKYGALLGDNSVERERERERERMYARRHVTLNNLTKQHVLSFYSVFGRGLGLNAANRWYHARYKITFKILVIYRVIYTYFAYFTRPLTKA